MPGLHSCQDSTRLDQRGFYKLWVKLWVKFGGKIGKIFGNMEWK